MAEVREIGRCPGCLKMASITEAKCCRVCSQYGPRFGELAARIRADSRFREKCYAALKTDEARRKFRDTFGGGIDQENMAEGSR